jgi:hypothetical protein
MSNVENKPESQLPSISRELADKVKQELGWEYPIDDGEDSDMLIMTEPTDEEWEAARKQVKGLSETDPEIAKLQDEIHRFLKGENTDE